VYEKPQNCEKSGYLVAGKAMVYGLGPEAGRSESPNAARILRQWTATMTESIKPYDMLTAAPVLAVRAALEAELEEIISLSPSDPSRLPVSRVLRDLTAAIAEAAKETPVCDAEVAAKIMKVSTRQATKLARSRRVKATQTCPKGPWVFDVRSCRSYSATKRGAKC
jgi:hypothetical protein